MSEVHTGGCLCGAVRFRLNGAPMFIHCCHCTDCQRLSGSAFVVSATIERNRLSLLQGVPLAQIVPTGSGRTRTIMRCGQCGVPLWSRHPDLGPRIARVFTGSLDEPRRWSPTVHCFVRSRQPWVVIPAATATAEAHYDHQACWPSASLRRLADATTD